MKNLTFGLWFKNALGDKYTAESLQKKWRNLRDTFIRSKGEMEAYVPSGSQATNKKRPWKYYYAMAFLNDTMNHRSEALVCTMAFKIFEFENGGCAVIPTTWVNEKNEVPWNATKATSSIFKNKQPKKEWKTYKVKPLISKVFNTYVAANSVLIRILEVDNTDVHTTDIESEEGHLSKQSRKNRAAVTLSSSESENEVSEVEVPINFGSQNVPILSYDEFIKAGNSNVSNNTFVDVTELVCNENRPYESSQDNNGDMLHVPNIAFTKLTRIIEEMAQDIKDLRCDMATLKSANNSSVVLASRHNHTHTCITEEFRKNMPLSTVEELLAFEKRLEKEEEKQMFKDFLDSFVLRKKTMKESVACFVEKVYSLKVQNETNYSGVNGKLALKKLVSTDIIINSIVKHSVELLNMEELKAVEQASVEFRYHLQHASDRLKSGQKKTAGISNVRRRRQGHTTNGGSNGIENQ
ncbi:hypothetical protein FQR65_LT18429 [Abscondita terminalis]|nr:hypothetical protein FQR65_LT18429 [Abscondita terminalis]